jgi:hypothetical protein
MYATQIVNIHISAIITFDEQEGIRLNGWLNVKNLYCEARVCLAIKKNADTLEPPYVGLLSFEILVGREWQTAEVTWLQVSCSQKGTLPCGMGVRFVRISKKDRSHISQAVNEHNS